MANSQLIELQLDVINQTIEYKGQEKVIPESYWKDTLLPFLYPNWDSDKDKLVMYAYNTNATSLVKRRKYVKNFTKNTFEWVTYEMEAPDAAQVTALNDKLIEGFFLIDSIEDIEFQDELTRMYQNQTTVSTTSVRLARDFLLDETDWSQVADCPLSADNKALYVTYRQKLRDIPASTEFTTAVENTKFPISPEFYNKIYLPKNAGVAYLSTDDQFKPLGEHYLRAFRDKISHYLVLKSFTEKGMFDLLLKEYGDFTRPNPIQLDPSLKAQQDQWLDDLIAQAEKDYKSS